MKKWMQGIGLVYTLLLLGICLPGWKAGTPQNYQNAAEYMEEPAEAEAAKAEEASEAEEAAEAEAAKEEEIGRAHV